MRLAKRLPAYMYACKLYKPIHFHHTLPMHRPRWALVCVHLFICYVFTCSAQASSRSDEYQRHWSGAGSSQLARDSPPSPSPRAGIRHCSRDSGPTEASRSCLFLHSVFLHTAGVDKPGCCPLLSGPRAHRT